MNDNVKKVFEILGVEPNEEFKLQCKNGDISDKLYHIGNELDIFCGERLTFISIALILKGIYKIIKLPKKKKLRDLTVEEYGKWHYKNCRGKCSKCLFCNVYCSEAIDDWIHHKDLYSDKFLDQEIEVEE